MYSLMLMAAVAGGPDASGFGWRTGCTGCTGYYAGCHGGYSGSSCYGSSCYGSGYGSCHGNCHGGGLFSRLFGGSSCHGSCYGSSCYGAGYGSCYGSGYRSGCWGSSYGHGHGCSGSYYTPATYGPVYGCTGCTGGMIVPGVPMTPPVGVPPPSGTPAALPMKTSSLPAPASLTVALPAPGAKLFVDGVLAAGDAATRKFHTPALPADQAFFYDLKAEVVVNGTVQTEETRVIVRSGDKVTATFPKLTAALSTDRTLASK